MCPCCLSTCAVLLVRPSVFFRIYSIFLVIEISIPRKALCGRCKAVRYFKAVQSYFIMYKISCMCKINSHSVVVVCLARVQTRDSETQRTAQLSHNHLSSTHAPRRLICLIKPYPSTLSLAVGCSLGFRFLPCKIGQSDRSISLFTGARDGTLYIESKGLKTCRFVLTPSA